MYRIGDARSRDLLPGRAVVGAADHAGQIAAGPIERAVRVEQGLCATAYFADTRPGGTAVRRAIDAGQARTTGAADEMFLRVDDVREAGDGRVCGQVLANVRPTHATVGGAIN